MIIYSLRENGINEWGIYARACINNGQQENLLYNLGKVNEVTASFVYAAFYAGRSA